LRIDDDGSDSDSEGALATPTTTSNASTSRRHHRTSRDLDDNSNTNHGGSLPPALSAIGTVASLGENGNGSSSSAQSHRSMGRSPRRSNSRSKVLFGSGGLEPLRALSAGLRRSHESLRHSASSPRGPSADVGSGLGVSSAVGTGASAAAGALGTGGGSGNRASRQKLARRIEQLKRELRDNTKEIRRLSVKAALWDEHKASCAAAAAVVEPRPEDLPRAENSSSREGDLSSGASQRSPRTLAEIYSSPQRVNNAVPRRKTSKSHSSHRGASPFGRYAEYRPHSSGNLQTVMQVEPRESTINNNLRRRRYSGIHGALVSSPPPAFSLSMSPLSPPGRVGPIGAGVSLKSQSPVTSPRTSFSLTRAPQRQR
jgi:hypothetical protein